MKKLEIKNGTLFLDGEKVPCVRSFELKVPENSNIAELKIHMDVTLIRSMQPEP